MRRAARPPAPPNGLPRRAAWRNIAPREETRPAEASLKLYHLYGLAVASEFACPELSAITPAQAAARGLDTVHVLRAEGPLTLPDAQRHTDWMWVTPQAVLYDLPDIARLRVERPDRIRVAMRPGAPEADMRAYLFGLGFATLLHMRGLIPLHLSAIRTPEGVVAFTGPSGAGKSTRVAELHFRHGWPMICDDVAVLRPSDTRPLLHGGMHRIKLWRDSVERFGLDPERLVRDTSRHDKFHLHAPEMFVEAPCPLERLVEIADGGKVLSEPTGARAFVLLMNAVYRPEVALAVDPDCVARLAACLTRVAAQINPPRDIAAIS